MASSAAATTLALLEGVDYTVMDPSEQPNAISCDLLRQELQKFLLSMPSTLGGGRHGHLALMMTAADYTALNGNPAAYIIPQDPGPLNLQANLGSANITNRTKEWEEEKEAFKLH